MAQRPSLPILCWRRLNDRIVLSPHRLWPERHAPFPLAIARFLLSISLIGFISGCADLTKVTDINVTQPQQFESPSGAQIRFNGAVGVFATAFANQVLYSGAIADELTTPQSSNFTAADERRISVNAEFPGAAYPYDELSTAHVAALRGIESLQRWLPYPRHQIAELYAYDAFGAIFFAENMCSGEPLAVVLNGIPTVGPELTRAALLRYALSDLDSAARYSSDSGVTDTSVAQLIQVGTARAFLDSGDFDRAAAATATVPTQFTWQVTYDSVVQQNAIALNLNAANASVSDDEGGAGLNFRSGEDPRVQPVSTGIVLGADTVFSVQQYQSPGSAIVLASGIEAQLIRAEASLHRGDVAGWADTLNSLRNIAISPSIPSLPFDSSTAASARLQLSVMFRERAFWLFLTGHRQGDLRRLVRQYGEMTDAVFPHGTYLGAGGGTYGEDVTFVPFGEQSNPLYHGCIDRNP
jgi:hypothetical protein